MKRLSILSSVFIVLAGVVTWFYFNQNKEAGTLVGADRAFAVEEIDQIQKIFLAHRIDGTTVLLERNGDHWRYNGKYKARPNAIENLLSTIGKVQMMYKPSEAAVPNMLADLSTRSIKVEIYGHNETPLKVYYVGGGTADERGTFMIMEDAEQPYVAHIPSWEGNLRFRYNLKGDEWRDRAIFNTAIDETTEVSVEYPKQRENSFLLQKEGNNFSVQPFYELQTKKEAVASASAIENFLHGFKSIGAEAFKNDHQGQDSIRQLIPFSIITLKTAASTQKVTLYPIYPNNLIYDNKVNQYFGSAQPVERYFVDINGEDFMMAQHRVIKEVLWGYDFFFR